MSSSPEHKTIENLSGALEVIFKGCDRETVHFLKREGFIRESVCEDVLEFKSMLSERDKAGKLVDGIRDAIFLDSSKFHTLLNHLRECGKFYESTVQRMSEELVKLGGVVQKVEADSMSPQNAEATDIQEKSYTTRTLVEMRHYGHLLEQLAPCYVKWDVIAKELSFHPAEIEIIRNTPSTAMQGPSGYMGGVVSHWMNWAKGDGRGSQDRATLEALKTAVSRAGFSTIADGLTLPVPKTRTLVEDYHYGYLMEQLIPCSTKWDMIATGLRFHPHEIETIHCNPVTMLRGSEACLGEVLSQWMHWAKGDARKSKDMATLEALKTAVSKAGFGRIAEGLTLTEP